MTTWKIIIEVAENEPTIAGFIRGSSRRLNGKWQNKTAEAPNKLRPRESFGFTSERCGKKL